jgi:hypothetical protein
MTICDELPKLKISWSSLQAHELCAQKAHLMREKHKSPASDIRNFFHGIVADRIMRAWLESDNPVSGEMVSWVDDFIESCLVEAKEKKDGVVRWRDPGDRARVADWIRVLVGRLEPFLQQHVLPYDFEPEFRFKVPIRIPNVNGDLAEIYLTGGMDILVREALGPPAVWAGYDLKATENPSYLSKTLGQGIFYSLAHMALTGDSFRTFAFVQPMVASNPVAHVNITQDDLASMLARVTRVAHDRWAGRTDLKKDSDGCSRCFVRHACPRFLPSAGTGFAPKNKRRNAA